MSYLFCKNFKQKYRKNTEILKQI